MKKIYIVCVLLLLACSLSAQGFILDLETTFTEAWIEGQWTQYTYVADRLLDQEEMEKKELIYLGIGTKVRVDGQEDSWPSTDMYFYVHIDRSHDGAEWLPDTIPDEWELTYDTVTTSTTLSLAFVEEEVTFSTDSVTVILMMMTPEDHPVLIKADAVRQIRTEPFYRLSGNWGYVVDHFHYIDEVALYYTNSNIEIDQSRVWDIWYHADDMIDTFITKKQ